MKKTLLLTFSLFFVASVSLAQNKTTEPPKWKEFTFTDAGIKASFPLEPERKTTERDGPLGKFSSTSVYVNFPRFTLMLIWAEFPKSYGDSEDALKNNYDFLRDQMLKSMSGKLESEKDVKVDGRLGREIVFATATQSIKYRVFVIGKWQYQVITARDSALETDLKVSSDVDQFLNSFHFISQ